jgi:hypothetical protein
MRKTILFIILFTFVGCAEKEIDMTINNPLIKHAYDKKKKEYAEETLLNCRKQILDRAEFYVDSLIAAEIDFQMSDSIVFPLKPIKPASLGKIIVPDTIMAKPIFK